MEFLAEIRWLNLILEYFLKTTLILSVAMLLAFLLRRKTAAERHLVLSLFFIGLLFLPLLSSLTQGWQTQLLPSWQKTNNLNLSSNALLITGETTLAALESNTFFPDISIGAEENLHVQGTTSQAAFSKVKSTLGYAALLLWVLGASFLLFRLLLGLYGAFRLTQEGKQINESTWKRLMHRFLTAVSLKRSVSLMSHRQVLVPLTWGMIKPVVMMPAKTEDWTEDQRSSALFHELSHVKRADFFVMLLARISLTLFWFNPLSWAVFRMIKKEQEKACDELVLKAGIKPSTYAAHLLAFRRSLPFHWNPPTAVLGAMGRSQLDDRLTTILKQKLNLKEITMKTKILLGILVLLSISFIGMARSAAPAIDESVMNVPVQEVQEQAQVEKQDPIPAQTLEQEQKQEKKKTKKTEKKTKEEKEAKEEAEFVWTTKASGDEEVEITIVDKDGKTKSFTLTSPTIFISKDGEEKKIHIIRSPHLDMEKDEKGNFTIRSTGKVQIDEAHLDETKNVIKIEDGAVVTIKTKGKDGDKVIKLESPAIYVATTVHAEPDVHIKMAHVDPEVHVETVHVDPEIHIETVHVDPEVDVAVDVAVPEHEYKRAIAFSHPIQSDELSRKQLKKIEETLKKANEGLIEKEEALKEIEEALAEINERLEHTSEELRHANVYLHTAPHTKAISIRRSAEGHAEGTADIWIADNIEYKEKEGSVIATIKDDGKVTLLFHNSFDKESKEKFEQVIKKLKEEFPEGYEIKSRIKEDSGTITITITGLEEEDRKEAVKKIIETVKKELKKIE